MKPIGPKFTFYYQDKYVEVFQDGLIVLYYRITNQRDEWDIKKDIAFAESDGRVVRIVTTDSLELTLDFHFSLLAHNKL